MRAALLLTILAALSGCGPSWTNCGDAYFENMTWLENGEYQVRHIKGAADILPGVDRLNVALDRQAQTLTLSFPDGTKETYAVSGPTKP